VTTADHLPQALRNLRHRSGLSQGDIAAQVGTTAAVIGRYELGKQEPRTSRLLAMLEVMDWTLGDLWVELASLNGHPPPSAAYDPHEILRLISEQRKRIRELEGKTDTKPPEDG
jgi:transcriptional regulator with XRE-family HTH domain